MTYGHLQADCLYTGISSGPNARYRVWENLYLFLHFHINYSQKFAVYRVPTVIKFVELTNGSYLWSDEFCLSESVPSKLLKLL